MDTALRSLKGNGKLYFLEPGPDAVKPLLEAALDSNDLVGDCVASVEYDACIGVVTKTTAAEKKTQKTTQQQAPPGGVGMGTSSSRSTTKRSSKPPKSRGRPQ
mmetsp:Transcript_11495/g.37778  ORF Transcript_11495/g.37778 Transcript_11495/m.37778 type:complete len:103 (+) Transcript_11495:353-661(+)